LASEGESCPELQQIFKHIPPAFWLGAILLPQCSLVVLGPNISADKDIVFGHGLW